VREAVSAQAQVFHHVVKARFGACDPVGIAYFPRYFDWFHQAMEAWFDDALGQPYHALLTHHGLPAVHTEADYHQPVRFGETITVELQVGRLGRSSIRLDYRVVGPAGSDDLRATGHTVCVYMGTNAEAADHMRPAPFPEALRIAIAPFLHPSADAR